MGCVSACIAVTILAYTIVSIFSLTPHPQVTDSTVMYDILNILLERFSAKDVELLLTVLRCVGFTLRKEDPAALRELILRLQARAAAATAGGAAADRWGRWGGAERGG